MTKFALDDSSVWADLAIDSSLTTHYLNDDGIDRLLARVDMTGSLQGQYWYLTDHLGSIRAVVDDTGAIVDEIAYDAYGNIASETDANYRGRYAWTGREIEAEVGLQFNRARYYDPAIGRWISKDPMGFDAGDSNLYRYVHNSPTNHTDPSGRSSVSTLISLINPCLLGQTSLDHHIVRTIATRDPMLIRDLIQVLRITQLATPAQTAQLAAGLQVAQNLATKLSNHIFIPRHNLGPLLARFNGSQLAAHDAVLAAIRNVPGLTGRFNRVVVNVNGVNITVNGNVVNGVAEIGTFFIPP